MLTCTQIICKVENLSKAVSDYGSQGFSVEWGSDPKKANNAFIWFDEGPVIELFKVPEWIKYFGFLIRIFFGKQVRNRFLYWSHSPQGFCNITLSPSDSSKQFNLKIILPLLESIGLKTSRIIKGSRENLRGQKVRYSFCIPMRNTIPLIASHYDPPQIPTKIRHENGSKKIDWIKVGVSKSDWDIFKKLTKKESRIRIQKASKTSILSIGISGLKNCINEKILHGASIKSTEIEQRSSLRKN